MNKIILFLTAIIFSTILSAQELNLLIDDEDEGTTGDSIEVLLRGTTEYCVVTITASGSYGESDCLTFNNSKEIPIVCTKKKNLCKTKEEIFKYISTKLSTPSREMEIPPKVKTEKKLDVSDIILDFKELKSKKVCITGNITAMNEMIILSDPRTDASSSINLDIKSLNRETKKEILTKCGFMSDNCKEVTLCGTVKEINYDKGLLVDEIK